MATMEDMMSITDAMRKTPTKNAPGKSGKRHWGRWIFAGIAVVAILLVGQSVFLFMTAPTTPPLALSRAAASAPVGSQDGAWDVAAGSQAGFRATESALGMSNDAVGRTKNVTGNIAVAGNKVTSATFAIDIASIKVDGKTQAQVVTSLDAQNHPSATVTLTSPMTLSADFKTGGTTTTTVPGQITMRGSSHPVSFKISGRRDGATLQFAGSAPIAFSDWGIKGPAGSGSFGELADHGVADFVVVLKRR